MNSCILWDKAKDKDGYGYFWDGTSIKKAHRVAYEKAFGEIPKDLSVLHKCDNRDCVNPEHLFLGTQQDNIKDMVSKSRQALGGKNGKSKLTEKEVLEIRETNTTTKETAELFGVSQSQISGIKNRRYWRHI